MFALEGSREKQDFRSARRNVQDPVQGFKACNDGIADAVQKPRIPRRLMGRMPLSEFVQKAGEACHLVCDVTALRDGKAFFQAVVDNERKCKIAFYVGLYGNTDS